MKETAGNLIKWLLDGLKEQWETWYNRVYAFIESIVNVILNFISDVVAHCQKMIWDYGWYFYELTLGEEGFCWYPLYWSYEFIDWGMSFFPEFELMLGQHTVEFAYAMELIGKLDLFFPMYEFGVLFGIFLLFIAFFLILKTILKLIPTIG